MNTDETGKLHETGYLREQPLEIRRETDAGRETAALRHPGSRCPPPSVIEVKAVLSLR